MIWHYCSDPLSGNGPLTFGLASSSSMLSSHHLITQPLHMVWYVQYVSYTTDYWIVHLPDLLQPWWKGEYIHNEHQLYQYLSFQGAYSLWHGINRGYYVLGSCWRLFSECVKLCNRGWHMRYFSVYNFLYSTELFVKQLIGNLIIQ